MAVAALTNSIQTVHTMGQALTNATIELQRQENIDKEIMARLDALESALIWVGKTIEAQKPHLSLHSDWEHFHNSLSVTPLPWNDTEQDWETVKKHLQGAFDKSLQQNIQSLHTQLRDQLRTLQTEGTKGVDRCEKLSFLAKSKKLVFWDKFKSLGFNLTELSGSDILFIFCLVLFT